MKYSFLLPAYKAQFLDKSLKSILNQTYGDFDVIVSDDCSPDDIKSIVDKFHDSRLTYRRNDENIGSSSLAGHWNLLLELTDADYVIMASDDDEYAEDFLSEIDRLVNRYPDVDVLRPRICQINEYGNVLAEEACFEKELVTSHEYLSKFADEVIWSALPQYVFKRSALLMCGGFEIFPLAWFSDDATVCKLSKNGMALSNRVLFSFRISSRSITFMKPTEKMVKQKLIAACEYANFLMKDLGNDSSNIHLLTRLFARARGVCFRLMSEFNSFTFVKLLFYSYKLKCPELFSWKWCVRLSVAYTKNVFKQ